jgi:hypothetical protein
VNFSGQLCNQPYFIVLWTCLSGTYGIDLFDFRCRAAATHDSGGDNAKSSKTRKLLKVILGGHLYSLICFLFTFRFSFIFVTSQFGIFWLPDDVRSPSRESIVFREKWTTTTTTTTTTAAAYTATRRYKRALL